MILPSNKASLSYLPGLMALRQEINKAYEPKAKEEKPDGSLSTISRLRPNQVHTMDDVTGTSSDHFVRTQPQGPETKADRNKRVEQGFRTHKSLEELRSKYTELLAERGDSVSKIEKDNNMKKINELLKPENYD